MYRKKKLFVVYSAAYESENKRATGVFPCQLMMDLRFSKEIIYKRCTLHIRIHVKEHCTWHKHCFVSNSKLMLNLLLFVNFLV